MDFLELNQYINVRWLRSNGLTQPVGFKSNRKENQTKASFSCLLNQQTHRMGRIKLPEIFGSIHASHYVTEGDSICPHHPIIIASLSLVPGLPGLPQRSMLHAPIYLL
jgi:hypothetical protein